MVKSSRSSPSTAPFLSVATTSTTTKRVMVFNTVADSYTGAGFCSAGAWAVADFVSADWPVVDDCGVTPFVNTTIRTKSKKVPRITLPMPERVAEYSSFPRIPICKEKLVDQFNWPIYLYQRIAIRLANRAPQPKTFSRGPRRAVFARGGVEALVSAANSSRDPFWEIDFPQLLTNRCISFHEATAMMLGSNRAPNRTGEWMMQHLRRRCLLLAVILLVVPSALFAQCGVERWSVKTGTDPDAGRVNLNSSTNTTVASMRAFTAPNPIPANNRVSPAETTQWLINATLTQYKLESDSDYDLILQDASVNTMIVEIPSPTCVGAGSPFFPGIQNSRSEFDAKFTATTSFQTANIPVQVKGVGMFDFLHGQTGVAPNGIELHPVLDIIFNSGTTPNFVLSASPSTLSVTQGGTNTTTISTTVSGGFNSAISLSATGLPAGVTAAFSPTSIAAPGSGSSTLTFTASSTATTGTSTVTINASGGGVSHSTTVSLTVSATATPAFALSASPSSVSVAQGGTGTSTISTMVSGGFNSAISLSATGLPAGVTTAFNPTSIAAPGSGSSTLTFTASSTATAGTSTVTVNASGGGISHSTTVSLTVTSGGTTTQILGNPGFENGSANTAPWTLTSGVINNSTSEPPHSGSWDAWLNGYGATHTDTALQQVTIPSAATAATLSFFLHIDSAETSTTTAFDTLTVQIRNSSGTVLSTLATYSNLNKATGYSQKSFNLLSFEGQTIQIFFKGAEDFELQTSFVLDDVTLNVTQ